jgi:ABC-type multidrug transport system fused ATPase/permease subunit
VFLFLPTCLTRVPAVVVLTGMVISSASFIFYTLGAFRASRSIHKQLIESVLGTSLRWLDVTPTSRVIARCTVDIRAVDSTIAHELLWLLEASFKMLVQLAGVVLFTPIFVLPGVLVGFLGRSEAPLIVSVNKHSLGGWCGQMYIAAQVSPQTGFHLQSHNQLSSSV